MSNEFDEETEFESPDDFDSDIPFEEENTIGDVWKNNPLVKMGIILAAFVAVVGSIILFGGGNDRPDVSVMRAGSELREAPGSEELSPAMRQALEENNAQTAEEAMRKGESTIPVPIDPPQKRLTMTDDEPPEDPLERWRLMQKERLQAQRQQELLGQPIVQECAEAQRAPVADELAGLMAQQMQQVLESKTKFGMQYRMVTKDYAELMGLGKKGKNHFYADPEDPRQGSSSSVDGVGMVDTVLIPAGEIEYAQLITEANTDAPGPVLAQVVTGPLAGSRILGEFSATDDFLVLTFHTIVKDGVALSCDAYALDPETTLPGVVTEIDRRYFSRIILPAAAKFIEGMGGAIADSGSTTVTVINGGSQTEENDLDTREEFYKGVEEAASLAAEVLEEDADDTEPMIRVAAGTPVGILFVDSVIDGVTKTSAVTTEDEETTTASVSTQSSQAQQMLNIQQQLMSLQQQMTTR